MSLVTSRANNGRNPDVVGLAGSNLTSSDIAASNRLVARWTSSTNTVARLEADENQIGVQLPTVSANRILGVMQLNGSDQVLSPYEDAPVIRGGRARLWVKVPASVDLPKGTGLVPAMGWDSTNHVAVFGTANSATVANVGYAEAVIKGAGIYQPANPIAWLSKALTSTASDTYQLAEVEVDYNHKPVQFSKNLLGLFTPADSAKFTAHVPFGPCVITGLWAQALDWTGTGKVIIDLTNCPLLATTDATAMLSTSLTLDGTGSPSDGALLLAGAGGTTALCSLDGDIDTNVAYGSTGSNGVFAAIGKRTMIANSMLTATISGSASSMAKMQIGIEGYYI